MRSVLVDAGPLVALMDAGDEDHAWAKAQFEKIQGRAWTVWPAVTEAAYLLQRRGASPAHLLELLAAHGVDTVVQQRQDILPIAFLLTQYADLPMDLADAAAVHAYHAEGFDGILTTDVRDFSIYRVNGRPLKLITPFT